MYVIKRTDQGGGYLSEPGSKNAYTFSVNQVRLFPTKEAAELEKCPDNEVVLPASECFRVIY